MGILKKKAQRTEQEKMVENVTKVLCKSEEEFKRYAGVPKWLFWEMTAELVKTKKAKEAKGGPKTKLICREMMMMTLCYWREYRTYFHIGSDYGISESNCWKIVKWVEDTLIKCEKFHLPGKKALLEGTDRIRRINLTDGSDCQIERPKKTETVLYRQAQNALHKKSGSSKEQTDNMHGVRQRQNA
jgi:hypothetical protein